MSPPPPGGALLMAGSASAALFLCDPFQILFALPLLLFTAWALLALPLPSRRLLPLAFPALGGSLTVALLAHLGSGEGPRVLLLFGLRALLLTWIWAWTATALTHGALAAFLHHRLRLATPADLILVMGRLAVLLAAELRHRRRAVCARGYRGRYPTRLKLLILLVVGLFAALARRAQRAAWSLCARGFARHLLPPPPSPARSILPEVAMAALVTVSAVGQRLL